MVNSVSDLAKISNKLRIHVIEMIAAAGSGHPGGSLSSADLMAVLYFRIMKHDPKDPSWDGRDRFVLSKGHVAPILYASLAESGYFPVEDLISLRKIGSKLQGHPVKGKVPGVEMSTGSLGQGLSMACGIATSLKMDQKPNRVFCLLGDGEMQSGQNWEAVMFAAHKNLNNLTAFVDRNCLQITGNTEDRLSLGSVEEKFTAFGWNAITIDGHDINQIIDACEKSENGDKPTAIIMNTVKGKGVSFMENNVGFHGKAPNKDETIQALEELRGKN